MVIIHKARWANRTNPSPTARLVKHVAPNVVLSALRHRKGLSVLQVALAAGLRARQVYAVESHKPCPESWATLVRVAAVFGAKVEPRGHSRFCKRAASVADEAGVSLETAQSVIAFLGEPCATSQLRVCDIAAVTGSLGGSIVIVEEGS